MNAMNQELRAALRADFNSFLVRCFVELNPRTDFLANWHIDLMASKLQAAMEGKIKRLIICIPPRHLKSMAASIALPAWWLGRNPSAGIINVTYGQDLTDKFARDCRQIIQAPWYQQAFPTRLTGGRAALQELVTKQNGFRLATSVGGVLTGRGADVLIIDDPLKPADAMSDVRRVAVNDWYRNTLYTRLNDKRNGTIILVMQRLHEDDLVGHVLGHENWEVVTFPAIAESDETFVYDTPFGPRTHLRVLGDVLHPERESRETLEQLRRAMGEYNFAGQYQQSPAPAGGGLVKDEWFRRYGPEDLPEEFEEIVQSWDTANKVSQLSDFSVCTTWGKVGDTFYLLDVFRKKLTFPELRRAMFELDERWDPTVIIIEDKASGTQAIQDMKEANMGHVFPFKPIGDKQMRMHAQTAPIENGLVLVPREAPWLADYLKEMTVYPRGKYDDQVDSTSQALAWSKLRPPGWGWLKLIREENEKKNRGRPKDAVIRVIFGAGTTGVQMSNHPRYIPAVNGIAYVTKEEADMLVRQGYKLAED